MKKIIYIVIILVMIFVIGCGENVENRIMTENGGEIKNEVKAKILYDDFVGVGGYIVQDLVFDYSDRFDLVYEWCDEVKLPIEKFEASNIQLVSGRTEYDGSQYALVEMSGFQEEYFFEYIEKMKKEGFLEEHIQWDILEVYIMYKDNLQVSFYYTNQEYNPVVTMYILTGNVKNSDLLELDDVRSIIDNQILVNNKFFSKYAILEIANETIRSNGYTEYLLVTPLYYESYDEKYLPYYVIMKGSEIVFYEQGALSIEYPTNANIIEDKNGKQKLIISSIDYRTSSSAIPFRGWIKTYSLNKGIFEYDNVATKIKLDNTHILAIYDSGVMKYFILKENQEFYGKDGYKNKWVIDKEYLVE